MAEAEASSSPATSAAGAGLSARTLLALIGVQIGLHSTMAGVRMAAPLQALREGQSAAAVGVLMALFAAAPIALALYAGRMADRYGFHRPMHVAMGLSAFGALLAIGATLLSGKPHFLLLCGAAMFCGGGANFGLIAIQRTAGRGAADSTERMRVFSWLGIAPAMSNFVDPVLAGIAIDLAGFRSAYAALGVLPLLAWWVSTRVPREVPAAPDAPLTGAAWDLLSSPDLRRLLFVNWLLSASWDVHAFAVPILGHERGFSASTIGLVLGVFPIAVTAVRLLIPMLAHRLDEVRVLRAAMVGTALVFALYPLVETPRLMALCALLLGLTLGAVQPMIMSTLHQLTPEARHGEALALRSMTINFASTMMPLAFGAAGAAIGVAGLFWLMGAAVGAGNWAAGPLAARLRN